MSDIKISKADYEVIELIMETIVYDSKSDYYDDNGPNYSQCPFCYARQADGTMMEHEKDCIVETAKKLQKKLGEKND